MVETACAACDCKLDVNPIKVKIGGKTVEVCCDECAQKLKEAYVSATAGRRGEPWTKNKPSAPLIAWRARRGVSATRSRARDRARGVCEAYR
jgi:ribosome-binding protein aMBF1 (putative translation factor)